MNGMVKLWAMEPDCLGVNSNFAISCVILGELFNNIDLFRKCEMAIIKVVYPTFVVCNELMYI